MVTVPLSINNICFLLLCNLIKTCLLHAYLRKLHQKQTQKLMSEHCVKQFSAILKSVNYYITNNVYYLIADKIKKYVASNVKTEHSHI